MDHDKKTAFLFILTAFVVVAIVAATGGFMLASAVLPRPYHQYEFNGCSRAVLT